MEREVFMKTGALILAAGKGTRMKSDLPKVLHRMLDRPLIDYVVEQAFRVIDDKPVVVVGHQGEMVVQHLGDRAHVVWQREQKGTGHAVLEAKDSIGSYDRVLLLCGDTPLIREATMERLLEIHREEHNLVTLLTVEMEDPTGYGR